MGKLWDILRKFTHKTRTRRPLPVLLHHNEVIDDPTAVSNIFGRFFSDLSSRDNYPPDFIEHERDVLAGLPDFGCDDDADYNTNFTMKELTDAIQRSGSTSIGPDQIHYDFFRHIGNTQLNAMLQLYNFIWVNNDFPDAWRHSYIIPILKVGKDRTQVQSYRPIQLTSCMCKLLERMVAKRLAWCLEQHELLSTYQCAFRSGRSTSDHLVRLDSHIREGFLHHSSTLAVFLDIKSAYNMVSPTLLLSKMHHIGFRGHLLHFIHGYLQNRTFQVRSGSLSDVFEQPYGIVQGGVISPLLFNIAIDSLTDVIPAGVSIAIYADDCVIWAQGRRIPLLFQQIQCALDRVGVWSRHNGFAFSPAKSNAILFRRGLRRVDTAQLPLLKLLDSPIMLVDHVKYLGVIFDSKLNLHSHIEYIKGRAQKRISILKSVAGKSYGADRTILLRMYKSLIRPILEYSSFIIDGPDNSKVASLETIQNAALRIASGALRTSPVRALQVDTNVPPLTVRRKELLLRYFLKVQGDEHHPCRHLMDLDQYEQLFSDLSECYVKRIVGFPVPYRLTTIFQETGYDPPEPMLDAGGQLIAPWLLHPVQTILLLTQDHRHMTETDIQATFHQLVAGYPDYRLLFTDGSKVNTSVACAFTVSNLYSSFKLQSGVSIYTAELVAIREALKFVRRNRICKALICSDSQSAVKAMSVQSREHPVLIDILELYHRNFHDGLRCTVVWIPGHSGIAGNVRADFWAKKAHDKPEVTRVMVGYREYVPQVRKCVYNVFSKMWQDYRHTQLKLIKPATGYWDSCVRQHRKEEVVLCRMRLGHTLFTHSYIMDHLPPLLCDVCQCRQDVPHVLFECRKYRAARRDLRLVCRNAGLVMNLETLLGNSATANDALFHFLRQSGLLDKM